MLLGLYEEYGNAVQVAMFYRTEEDMRAFLACGTSRDRVKTDPGYASYRL